MQALQKRLADPDCTPLVTEHAQCALASRPPRDSKVLLSGEMA